MNTLQILLVLAFCLALSFPSLQAQTASQIAVGSADCFNQKLSGFLAQLIYFCNYVCTVNTVNGEALSGSYDPFGSQHAFPVMSSVEESIYELFYGTPANGFSAVSRNTTGTNLIGYFQADNTGYRLGYPVIDSNGEIDTSVAPLNVSYAPTLRSWYIGAVAASNGIYVSSTPYAFSSSGTLGISVAQTCLRNGELEIVSSTSALLDPITENYFTTAACSQFDSVNGAVAFVFNTQGILVFESDASLSGVINATESTNGAVRAAAAYALGQGFEVSSVGQGTFAYNGATWEIYATPVSSPQWNWSLAVIRPVTSTCSAASSVASPLASLLSIF